MTDPEVVFVPVRPDSDLGTSVLRDYVDELLTRWHGEPPVGPEIDAHLLDDSNGQLVSPAGIFVVARSGDEALGCGGLRFAGEGVPPAAAEIKRMWVSPAARGRGLGRRLLGHLTDLAREAGFSRLVLDTRGELTEARRLYLRHGFSEVAAYNANPHAQAWYAKELW